MQKKQRVISQREIDIVIAFEGLTRQRWEFHEEEARKIARQLADGVSVEPGPHTARLRKNARGESVLMLDGKRTLPPMKRTIGTRSSAEVLKTCLREDRAAEG
jgi:hypothetical protein